MKRIHPLPVGLLLASVAVVTWQANNVLLSGLVCLLLLLAGAIVAGPRRHLRRLGVAGGLILVLWWLFVAFVFPNPSDTGHIVLALPRHTIGPSVEIGGPVHAQALLLHLGQVCRSWALLLSGLLMLQIVPALRWLDLLALVMGRAAGLCAPALCLPEAISTSLRDRVMLTRRGITVRLGDAMADAVVVAGDKARRWSRMRASTPPSLVPRTVLAVVAVVLVPWLVADAVHIKGVAHAETALRTFLAASLLLLVVRLGRPGRAWLGRIGTDGGLLALAAVAVVGAWRFRSRTGDGAVLQSPVDVGFPPVLSAVLVIGIVMLAAAVAPRRRSTASSAREKVGS